MPSQHGPLGLILVLRAADCVAGMHGWDGMLPFPGARVPLLARSLCTRLIAAVLIASE